MEQWTGQGSRPAHARHPRPRNPRDEGPGNYPPYFLRLREVNRRGPAMVGTEPPPLRRLDVPEVRRLLAEGARLVDARPMEELAAGRVPGSLSIPLRDQFATWLGWLVEPDRPLVFVLANEEDEAEVVRQALKIGFERLAGQLAGGAAAWQATELAPARLPLVPAAEITGWVVDVRQDSEFSAGHLPGADHVELGALPRVRPQPDRSPSCADTASVPTPQPASSPRPDAGDLHVAVGGPGGVGRCPSPHPGEERMSARPGEGAPVSQLEGPMP